MYAFLPFFSYLLCILISLNHKQVDKNEKWAVPPPPFNAAEVDKYGYLLMSAPDAYTLDMAFISKSFNVYDNCTITRSTTFW